MSRIPTPSSIEAAPKESQPLLESLQKRLGKVPNIFLLVSNSPAALEGYLGMSRALNKGSLSATMREHIALAMAEFNGCSYCLSAHVQSGKRAQLSDSEIEANRAGSSEDPKAAVAVKFAVQIARERGHVNQADLQAVRDAGYSDAEIIEIIQNVALNTWTNYLNEIAATDIDFPLVKAKK